MKITRCTYWTEDLKLSRPYTIAYTTVDSVANIFVQLELEDGTIGLGVAAPDSDVTGESEDACRQALETHLEALLLGQDVRHLTAHCRNLARHLSAAPAARAAADMALHDLYAQHLQMPLVDILGRVHPALPTSITIGIQPAAEARQEAREYIRNGFRILKIKIGKSIEEDLDCVCQIREEVGHRVAIRVDANQGYSTAALKTFVQKTRKLDLEFIEQPLKADAIEEMRRLPADIRRRTAADESLLDETDALQLTHPPRPFGIYNIKLMKCGGLFAGLQIARIAHLAAIDVMWGCMDESIVSIAAALHAALASPATRYLDLDGSFDLAHDLVEGGFSVTDGCLRPTTRPGLGVTLKARP